MVLAPKRIPVMIEYCAPCEYLPQAVQLAHHLLFDFQGYIQELRLVPGTGGIFDVHIGGEKVYSNANNETFPGTDAMKDAFRTRLKDLTGYEA